MRSFALRRVLWVAIGFGAAGTAACFSSSSGSPTPGDDSGLDSGLTDSPSQPDSTIQPGEGGAPEAAPEAAADVGVPFDAGDAGAETSVLPDGGGAILLPGSVADNVHIAANHTTSRFYVAWNNTSSAPSTSGIAVIDAATGTITGTIDVRATGSLAVDEVHDLVYVPTVVYPDGSAIGTPSVVVVDGTSDTPIAAKTIYQGQGQTIDAGQGIVLSNLGMTYVAVDPVNQHLFAYLGDGSLNGFVFEYDVTSGALLASIETAGTEPGWGGGNETGGGLVLDANAHTLWVVGGDRPSFGPGATITTIDTQSFTVTATGTKQAANATDVTIDPAGDQAVVFMPQFGAGDGGGELPTPGSVLQVDPTGATSTALAAPAILARRSDASSATKRTSGRAAPPGNYYLVGFDVPDAGQWTMHGPERSCGHAAPLATSSFAPASALDAYSFGVVTGATHAHVIASMLYDTFDSTSGGRPSEPQPSSTGYYPPTTPTSPPMPENDDKDLRRDLAACYRLVALYDWDDLVFTHISARVPGPRTPLSHQPVRDALRGDHRVESLVKVDAAGKKTGAGHVPREPRGVRHPQRRARGPARRRVRAAPSHQGRRRGIRAEKDSLLPILPSRRPSRLRRSATTTTRPSRSATRKSRASSRTSATTVPHPEKPWLAHGGPDRRRRVPDDVPAPEGVRGAGDRAGGRRDRWRSAPRRRCGARQVKEASRAVTKGLGGALAWPGPSCASSAG